MASSLSAIHYKGFFLIYRLLGVALMLMVPAIALPDAHPLPMWQVDGEHNRIYILGSVHLLRAQDHPLTDAIYAAYEDAAIMMCVTLCAKCCPGRRICIAAILNWVIGLLSGLTVACLAVPAARLLIRSFDVWTD